MSTRKPNVRVLVLEAAGVQRQRHERLLECDGRLQLAGLATGAQHAVELAAHVAPDVMLIGHDGDERRILSWIRYVMETGPLPIVVASPSSGELAERHAVELMAAGALAVVRETPNSDGAGPNQSRLTQALRVMAEVKVVRRWGKIAPPSPSTPSAPATPIARMPRRRFELVAIGASTGGPVVLQQILSGLPGSFALPILIVQHMAGGFVHGLAQWLSASCAIRAEVATPATQVQPGRAYLAPDGVHMRLGGSRTLVLDEGRPVNGHRPAVSCLFESVAAHCGAHAIGILLTGMGKDGAAELRQMKDAGAVTIAQDGASSVVHGMPGEAIRRGGATYVMSPQEIAAALNALANR